MTICSWTQNIIDIVHLLRPYFVSSHQFFDSLSSLPRCGRSSRPCHPTFAHRNLLFSPRHGRVPYPRFLYVTTRHGRTPHPAYANCHCTAVPPSVYPPPQKRYGRRPTPPSAGEKGRHGRRPQPAHTNCHCTAVPPSIYPLAQKGTAVP